MLLEIGEHIEIVVAMHGNAGEPLSCHLTHTLYPVICARRV